MAYAGIGCTADGGSTYMLPRLVGVSKAMEIYMASQPIGAEYARELGLVNQVCPADSFDRHALEMATRLAQGPTVAYGRVKSLFEKLVGGGPGRAAGCGDRRHQQDSFHRGLPGRS